MTTIVAGHQGVEFALQTRFLAVVAMRLVPGLVLRLVEMRGAPLGHRRAAALFTLGFPMGLRVGL